MEDVARAGGKDEAAGQERNGLVSASTTQNGSSVADGDESEALRVDLKIGSVALSQSTSRVRRRTLRVRRRCDRRRCSSKTAPNLAPRWFRMPSVETVK
jgi:hypothetical protein